MNGESDGPYMRPYVGTEAGGGDRVLELKRNAFFFKLLNLFLNLH